EELADQQDREDQVQRERERQEERQPGADAGRRRHGDTLASVPAGIAGGSASSGGSVWIGSHRTRDTDASTRPASAPTVIRPSVLAGWYVPQLWTFIVTPAALSRFSTTPSATRPPAAHKRHLRCSTSGVKRSASGTTSPTTISSQNHLA